MRKLAQGTRIDILHLHFLTKTYKHSLTLLHSYTKPHYSKLPSFLSTMTFYYSFFFNTMTFIMNMRDYIYIYILKGDIAQMVEHGKAYPKNEDQYLAFSFFYKNLQALAHPALFIHKITPFKICPFL